MNYVLDKYKKEWGIFCNKSRCWVLFGNKKQMVERINQLNNDTNR